MIVDERFVTYINSLDTENTPFLEELEKNSKRSLCTDYPKGNAEPAEITAGNETSDPDTGGGHGRWFFCPFDGGV